MSDDAVATATATTFTTSPAATHDPLLDVRDLQTAFVRGDSVSRPVDGVSFAIRPGQTFGLVGESGCGKSMTALSLLRLVPEPFGRIVGGQAMFEGHDLAAKTERQMRAIRGARIAMIFQEPMTSLNPVHTAGAQIAEVYRLHQNMSRRQALEGAVEMLRRVRIPDPERRLREYPHQMSGGMRQRIMIAMALACNPALLIADEPTTALDVTIQAQILALMRDLQRDLGTSILIISHDLGVIAEMADHVAVMYAGKIVESATVDSLFAEPRHPYTRGLLRSIPRLSRTSLGRKIEPVPGAPPDPGHYPAGCRFHPRCPFVVPACVEAVPDLRELTPGHLVRCLRPQSGQVV